MRLKYILYNISCFNFIPATIWDGDIFYTTYLVYSSYRLRRRYILYNMPCLFQLPFETEIYFIQRILSIPATVWDGDIFYTTYLVYSSYRLRRRYILYNVSCLFQLPFETEIYFIKRILFIPATVWDGDIFYTTYLVYSSYRLRLRYILYNVSCLFQLPFETEIYFIQRILSIPATVWDGDIFYTTYLVYSSYRLRRRYILYNVSCLFQLPFETEIYFIQRILSIPATVWDGDIFYTTYLVYSSYRLRRRYILYNISCIFQLPFETEIYFIQCILSIPATVWDGDIFYTTYLVYSSYRLRRRYILYNISCIFHLPFETEIYFIQRILSIPATVWDGDIFYTTYLVYSSYRLRRRYILNNISCIFHLPFETQIYFIQHILYIPSTVWDADIFYTTCLLYSSYCLRRRYIFIHNNHIPDLYSALFMRKHVQRRFTYIVAATRAQVHPQPVQIQHDLTSGTDWEKAPRREREILDTGMSGAAGCA